MEEKSPTSELEGMQENYEPPKNKLNLNKFHYLLLILFLIALPVLVYSVRVKTSTSSHAQEPSQVASADDFNLEDNPPPDPVVANDPVAVAKAQTAVDSLPSTTASTSRPNIVVIMVDDINPIDGRLWKSNRTPNIFNDIIATGVQFTNYYDETSLCCPGRVSFLTGQHTQNHGVADLDGTKFNPNETIATELHKAGYYTMLDGKYVNDYANFKSANIIPSGWKKFDAIFNNNGKYFNYDWVSEEGSSYTMVRHGSNASDYSTDVIANTAIKRLKEAPSDKPIFAFITPFASHEPMTPAPRYVNDPRCASIDPWTTAAFNESDPNKPQYIKDLPKMSGSGYNLKKICETQLAVDDLVGRVVKELKAEGRYNNTLLVFTADNGMAWGAHKWDRKTVPYSTQLPLYISWPAGRGTDQRVNSTFLSNIDFAPTLCQIAGCSMGNYPNRQIRPDGVTFLPLIKNNIAYNVGGGRDAILINQPVKPSGTGPSERPPWWGVITTDKSSLGRWMYVEYTTGEKELYDMSNSPCSTKTTPASAGDPCTLNNLLGPNVTTTATVSNLQKKLHQRLVQLKNEKGYVVPST